MAIVKQPTINPTNKLTAVTVATAVTEVARILLTHFAPEFADPALWAALQPVIVFAVGWMVHDSPNIIVEQ